MKLSDVYNVSYSLISRCFGAVTDFNSCWGGSPSGMSMRKIFSLKIQIYKVDWRTYILISNLKFHQKWSKIAYEIMAAHRIDQFSWAQGRHDTYYFYLCLALSCQNTEIVSALILVSNSGLGSTQMQCFVYTFHNCTHG